MKLSWGFNNVEGVTAVYNGYEAELRGEFGTVDFKYGSGF